MVGTIVAPATPAEAEATRQHLNSDADARSWGRRGWERAGVAQAQCERQRPDLKPSTEDG